MSDFVAKLRARTRPEICECAMGAHLVDGSEPDEDCVKAADTITRLTAENEKLREALEAALENGVGVSYSCDEDECGNHVCCGEVSYKPHAPDCWTLKARAVPSGDKQ
jgi:hypothetical protein